ncbi:hypothetical protein D3C87_369450 [compost metagenome]
MEKKRIISGQQPKGTTDKSYEMNGSHAFGTSPNKLNIKSAEEINDHYDRDEACNSRYDKDEKH